jgi:5'-3' exoribonuclease 1
MVQRKSPKCKNLLFVISHLFPVLLSPTPEEINWHLLQLCLLRDYIDLEFSSMKVKKNKDLFKKQNCFFYKEKMKFPYDLESIVDDWILMGYLVGNDFIPHLPHVHINQEALPLLWETYKTILPTLDGLLNFLRFNYCNIYFLRLLE